MLTLTHAAGDQIKTMISSIRQGLDFILGKYASVVKSGTLAYLSTLYYRQNLRRQIKKILQFSIRQLFI